MSWFTVSNAFEKSKKRPKVTIFLFKAFLSESVISKIACAVEYPFLRDLSEISRGERGGGGWKTGEGHSFLSPSKGRVMKKNDRKRGRVTRN